MYNFTGKLYSSETSFVKPSETYKRIRSIIDISDNRPIDGKDLMPILQGKCKSNYIYIYFCKNEHFTTIRGGNYKKRKNTELIKKTY